MFLQVRIFAGPVGGVIVTPQKFPGAAHDRAFTAFVALPHNFTIIERLTIEVNFPIYIYSALIAFIARIKMAEETPKEPLDIKKMIEEDRRQKQKEKAGVKLIKFQDYLDLVIKDPKIAQNSQARILEIIESVGREAIPPEEKWFFEGVTYRYRIFKKMFGLEAAIQEYVDHLRTGADDLPPGKKLLLLLGPPASGKSTFVDILHEALEKSDLRPVYRIQDCPIQEEPLNLLPEDQRAEFCSKTEVRLTARNRLCPVCRHLLKEKYTDQDGVVRWWDVLVEPFRFSMQDRVGVGIFEAGDKFQSVEELTGKENIQITTIHGPDHQLAYTLDGAILRANRGILEGIELLKTSKSNQEIMNVFISVAEEREVRVQGSNFPHIAVDVNPISHSNLHEFGKWNSDPANEAMHSRFRKIHFPYAIRICDEMAIYKKLIEKESCFETIKKCHIAPGCLELAALFAVLTRLSDSRQDIDRLTKAKIYNGDRVLTSVLSKSKKNFDLRELINEGRKNDKGKELPIEQQEGMFGIGPRDVLDALCNGLVRQAAGNGCLTPARAIKALRDGLRNLTGYTPEKLSEFEELLSAGEGGSVVAEYKDYVVDTVTQAFIRAYNDEAKNLFEKYLENARLHRRSGSKLPMGMSFKVERDLLSGKVSDPDTGLLEAIESEMGYSGAEAETARGDILQLKEWYESRGSPFTYETYKPLARAVEKKLLRDTKNSLKLTLSKDRAKEGEEKKRMEDILDALMDKRKPSEQRFCHTCSQEFVQHASEFLR